MKIWKRRLIVSSLLGAGLALALLFFAIQTGSTLLQPAFYIPSQVSDLISGAEDEPAIWLYHAVLFLQCFLAVLVAGWLFGRYRSQRSKA